ncbi:MAG: hypothetical protein NTW65_10350 [Deltaproteobacteria bacterium]|nr:hypothetical protein [Deltaproteobacteria bacterium]
MENSAVMPAEGGVLKEVLGTPFVKDIIRSSLKSRKPDKSHPLINALIWQDPEIILSVLGSIPPVVNSCVGALAEVGNQVNEKLSPELIKEYFASILKDIDTDEFKALAEAYTTLIKNLWEVSPELRDVLAEAVTDDAPPLIGKGINLAAHFVNEVNKNDPRLVSKFVSDVIENIDGAEFRDATHTIVNAFLDQKFHLISWTWQLLKKRMKRRK